MQIFFFFIYICMINLIYYIETMHKKVIFFFVKVYIHTHINTLYMQYIHANIYNECNFYL